MCTLTCPCPNSTNFNSWDETYLNKYGRTKLAKVGYVPLYKTTVGTTYSKFIDCYNAVNKTYSTLGKSSGLYSISTDLQTVIQFFENTLNCEGLCSVAPFYIYLDISNGPPTQSCLSQVQSTFSGKIRPLGILLVIIFLLCFLAFLTTYGLCYRRPDHKHHNNSVT